MGAMASPEAAEVVRAAEHLLWVLARADVENLPKHPCQPPVIEVSGDQKASDHAHSRTMGNVNTDV